MHSVPVNQRSLPLLGPAGSQISMQALVQQQLGHDAPFAEVLAGSRVFSYGPRPSYSQHQPHLTHMLGAMAGAAAVQPQLSAGVHNRFLSLTSGAAMVPSSAIGGGIGPGSGGGGGDGSSGSGAGGGGGKRKMASQRPLPALSWFDKNGGLVAVSGVSKGLVAVVASRGTTFGGGG